MFTWPKLTQFWLNFYCDSSLPKRLVRGLSTGRWGHPPGLGHAYTFIVHLATITSIMKLQMLGEVTLTVTETHTNHMPKRQICTLIPSLGHKPVESHEEQSPPLVDSDDDKYKRKGTMERISRTIR